MACILLEGLQRGQNMRITPTLDFDRDQIADLLDILNDVKESYISKKLTLLTEHERALIDLREIDEKIEKVCEFKRLLTGNSDLERIKATYAGK